MLCVLGSTCCPWNRMNIYLKKEKERNFTNILPNWASMTRLHMGKSWHSLGINGPYSCYRHLSNKQTEYSHMFEVHFIVPQMFLLKIFKLQGKNSLQILGMKPLPQRGLKGLLRLPLSLPTPKVMSEMLLKVALWCFHSSCTSRDF